MNPVLLIPARMASTRLPGKPLADIVGVPMIVRVWARAMAVHDLYWTNETVSVTRQGLDNPRVLSVIP